jgi:hypothetical protein
LFSIDSFCFGSFFLLIIMALHCFSFANKLHPLHLPPCWHYCHHLNHSTASLLLFLVPIIVVISHGFCCFFGNFLILLHSAFLVLLFCLVLFVVFYSELFIDMYALFVIHLIIT